MRLVVAVGLAFLASRAASAAPWTVLGPDGRATSAIVDSANIVVTARWTPEPVLIDVAELGEVAKTTLAVRGVLDPLDPRSGPGILGTTGVTRADLDATLAFVAEIASRSPEKLRDPAFLRRHFTWLRWRGDTAGAAERSIALEGGRIRLTRYLVFSVAGSPTRTPSFDTALYAVPAGTDADTVRLSLTKQEVYGGAFEPGGKYAGRADPLVWLPRAAAEQALLQGTIEIAQPDGTKALFNVDRSNEIAWDPSLPLADQRRFWFFQEVADVGGIEVHGLRTALHARAAVAGDLANLGLGALVALDLGAQTTLAVLADTGGAFAPNLFQLDLYAGVFPDSATYEQATADVPDQVDAWILVLRR
jgi:hypothetical protein